MVYKKVCGNPASDSLRKSAFSHKKQSVDKHLISVVIICNRLQMEMFSYI